MINELLQWENAIPILAILLVVCYLVDKCVSDKGGWYGDDEEE